MNDEVANKLEPALDTLASATPPVSATLANKLDAIASARAKDAA